MEINNWVISCFHLEYKAKQVRSNSGLVAPEVSHLFYLQVMDLDLVQETGGSSMKGLFIFHFYLCLIETALMP